jgi:hypothetical protein
VIYNLPAVIRAVKDGETIWITEGEKDADRLMSMGCTATTNFEGASIGKSKWKPEYSEYLSGAKAVHIIADRDEVGVAHAQAIAASLAGKVERIRVFQSKTMREHDDVSDHLEKYTLDELIPLRSEKDRSYRRIDLRRLLDEGVPPPVMIRDDFLYEGGLHSMAGAPDSGKTTVALCWALEVLQGHRPVIFMDEEGGPEIVTERFASLGAKPPDLEHLIYIPFPGRTWDAADVTALVELTGEVRPAMMIWDSSAAFLSRAGLDENAASDVTRWWAGVVTPIARELRVAIVVIDHDTKASEQSRYARGSGGKLAAIDVQYKVEMSKPFSRYESGVLKLNVTKDRRGYLHRKWRVEVETGNGLIHTAFFKDGPRPEEWSPAKRKIYGVLTNVSQTNKGIREQLAVMYPNEPAMARETVSRELNDLLREGKATRTGSETDATWKRLSVMVT